MIHNTNKDPEEEGVELTEMSKMMPSPASVPADQQVRDNKFLNVSVVYVTFWKLQDGGIKKKMPYPKGVVFIALTELAARFAYYGSRAVLTIYIRNVLLFSDDLATTIYHTFLLLCYCLPIVWGVAADSFLGMYKTLWIVNLLFLLGNGLLTASSLPVLPLPSV